MFTSLNRVNVRAASHSVTGHNGHKSYASDYNAISFLFACLCLANLLWQSSHDFASVMHALLFKLK